MEILNVSAFSWPYSTYSAIFLPLFHFPWDAFPATSRALVHSDLFRASVCSPCFDSFSTMSLLAADMKFRHVFLSSKALYHTRIAMIKQSRDFLDLEITPWVNFRIDCKRRSEEKGKETKKHNSIFHYIIKISLKKSKCNSSW